MLFLKDGARAALVSLINEQNTLPVPLTERDLYHGKLKPVNGQVELPTVTMFVSVYEGYARFVYGRVNLSQIFGTHRPTISAVGQNSLHAMLPMLSKAFGFTILPEDVYNVNITWLGGNEEVNIQIMARPESVGFEGSFVIKFIRVRPMLNTIVSMQNLDVLTHAWADQAKRSVDVLLWSVDFTGWIKNELRTHYTDGRLWANMPGLQGVMNQLGYAAWPQRTGPIANLKVYATKDLPQANKDFTHVIVQKQVVGADYAGTAYFHYNT